MEYFVDIPEEIYTERFTTIEERIKGTEIEKPFKELKEAIDHNDFQKYFNHLIKIKKHERDMLIITHSENHRAIIIREYLKLLQEIFQVSNVIIVVQAI